MFNLIFIGLALGFALWGVDRDAKNDPLNHIEVNEFDLAQKVPA